MIGFPIVLYKLNECIKISQKYVNTLKNRHIKPLVNASIIIILLMYSNGECYLLKTNT